MDEGPASAGVAHINAHGKQHHEGVLECRWTEDKGRVLHAARDFAEGAVILVESPLHIVQEDERCAAFTHLQQLCEKHADTFDYEALWYWCALRSLTQEQLRDAKMGGWAPAEPTTQHNLLLLHHDKVAEPSSAATILAEELAPGASPLAIERLTQVWVLNCFEYSDNPQGYSTYFFSSFMSHSCWPNAVWHYTGADHVLRARRAIKAGDEVCISYLPEHGLMQSAPVRRNELHDTKRFWCSCERCTGPQDLSRGFVCPRCSEGKVFAHTPEPGPAQDDTLLAAQLVGAVCSTCGEALSKKDAVRLAGQEKRIKKTIDELTARGLRKKGSTLPSIKEIHAAETSVEPVFAQHVLADLLWEQLADCTERAWKKHGGYGAKKRSQEQRRLLARRCAFHAAAYPGLNGSHAWALEACGDSMMHGMNPKAYKGDVKAAAKDEPEEALRLYGEARRILTLMFGEEHEYVQQVVRKCVAAQRALAKLQSAPSSEAPAAQG